jgi:formylglycine-generating enzyme required for sulfatase activity
VKAAGPNAVGFFYYSGHGAADAGTNYLIPVDVKTTETGELWDQSLRLTEITGKLKMEAGNGTHFVVFDACRNNLKLRQAGSRTSVQSKGFVPVAQESGMLIAYATAEGELATDVGAYAKTLAEEIVKPGVEAVVMFRNVQRRVRAAIKQEPFLGFNAIGDVYLAVTGTESEKTLQDCLGIEALVGNEKRCLKPGDSFKDCPEMIVIPAGDYAMGSEENPDEKPVHKVTIPKPFAVGKFEVTFAEWDACRRFEGCKHRPHDRIWGRGDRPVVSVSWDDITNEYIPWLSNYANTAYRLLSEAEWEYAARAGRQFNYTWGDEIGKNRANCDGCGSQWDAKQTAAVGSFQANAFGVHDMHGNVREWVADCYKDSYTNAPSDGKAALNVTGCLRVVRGGSWVDSPGGLRSANRIGDDPGDRYGSLGFRLARTLNP